MEPNTTNTQGLTAQQMGQVAENNMKDRVLQESASNPGKIIKGAQMGALQTGTESTPVTFQAKTNPVPLTDRAPGLKESMATGTISSAPADAYVKTLQDELKDKEDALRRQANESEMAIFNQVKPEDQEALRYWEKGARTENTLNIAPPGFTDTVKKLRDEKIEPVRAQMNEGQADAAATSRVNRIRSGQEGTGYGSASFTRQQTQFKRQQDAFAIQERDLLQDAWRSALSGQVKQAEELRNQADNTAKEREKAKADAAQARKDALAIDKMVLDNEKAGEDRVDTTVKRMAETGYVPNKTQLDYLDEKYGLDEGTSRTYYELAQINKEKADAKDDQERYNKNLESADKLVSLLDKVPIGKSVIIDGVEYSGQSRGAIKTGTETDSEGNTTFWEYNQDTKQYQTTSMGNIGKATDGWETRDLGEQGLWRVNAKTGQYVPYGPTQSQKDWQKPFPEGSTSPFKDAQGNPRVQCGAFVNDLTGAGVGDTLESKLAKCDKTIKLGSENPPRIGDFFVQDMNTWTGHISMYAGSRKNPATGKNQILALESNYPQPGKVTCSRWVNEEDILAFGRTGKIHPLLQSGPDSLDTSGSGTEGAAPSTGTSSPFSGVLGAGRGAQKEEDKLLSPAEAKQLGVAYGTTQSQAAKMGIVQTSANDEETSALGRQKDDKYLTAANNLADDYRSDSKDFIVQRNAYQNAESVNVNTTNPQDDISLVYSFMKVVDPTSVVRETEFNTAAKASSLLDQFNIKVGKVSTGQILNPTVRQQIKNTMETRYKNAESNQKQIVKAYEDRAKGYRIDPSDVILDYGNFNQKPIQKQSHLEVLPSNIGDTVKKAREHYNDDQLLDFFIEQYPTYKDKFKEAKDAGYSPKEIIDSLTQ